MQSMRAMTAKDLMKVVEEFKKQEGYYEGKTLATLLTCNDGRGGKTQQVLVFHKEIES